MKFPSFRFSKKPSFQPVPDPLAQSSASSCSQPSTLHSPLFTARRNQAFSLVEVTVAVGIAGFCLLAIFGLIPVGLNSNNASISQTTAANLARGIISDIRSTPKTNPPSKQKSPYFKMELPDTGAVTHTIFLKEDGSPAATTPELALDSVALPAQNPLFRVMVTFVAPAAVTSRNATTARILITWPALADKEPTTGDLNPPANLPTKFSGSYELVTAFDRN